MVCEGLAYLHFSHVVPQLANSTSCSARAHPMSPVDVANELRNNAELHEYLADEKRKKEWQTNSKFQNSVHILFRHRGDYMYELALSVKLPDVDADDRDVGRQLGTWLVNTALTVYASSSKPNDFFLLHGVTGAWSLLQVRLLRFAAKVKRFSTIITLQAVSGVISAKPWGGESTRPEIFPIHLGTIQTCRHSG